jgi:hypothetical protein
MKIYHVYFSGLSASRGIGACNPNDPFAPTPSNPHDVVDEFRCITEMMQNSSHMLIFILTSSMWALWRLTAEKYGWDKFTHYEMPYFVSNRNYPANSSTFSRGDKPIYNENTRRLRLVILKGVGKDET